MTNLPNDQLNNARTMIEQAQDVLIVVGSNPDIDSMATALAFYLVLSSQGKRTAVICPDNTTVEFSHLVGIDKVSNSLSGSSSGKNLVISFPYEEGSIEKVSYNIEGNAFNLVIEPRENYPTITQNMIRYSNSGGNTDVIITVNVSQLSSLHSFYQNNQKLFSEKPIINIDNSVKNEQFGKANLIDQSASSLSEILLQVLSKWNYPIDADSATNLLLGLSCGSHNFSSENTSATTFEAAAICLKNGARKSSTQPTYKNYQFPTQSPTSFSKQQKPIGSPTQKFQQPIRKPFTPTSSTPAQMQPIQRQQVHSIPQSPTYSQQQPYSSQPSSQPVQNSDHNQLNDDKSSTHTDAPPDWLKPKIYKGSTLL